MVIVFIPVRPSPVKLGQADMDGCWACRQRQRETEDTVLADRAIRTPKVKGMGFQDSTHLGS